ncbi:MAG: AI-2E family transporter [Thiotrichales bacterium]|nr:AI-2E family transporter [Thiotrichales bacterium]
MYISWYNKLVTDAQKWLLFACLALGGWLLYLLGPVLIPFAISALLAYLCDPVVDRLEARKLSRTTGVLIVFTVLVIIFILALLILIPLLQDQLVKLIIRIPEFMTWIQDSLLPLIANRLGIDVSQIDMDQLKNAFVQNWKDIGNALTQILGRVLQSGQTFMTLFSFLILIPVVTFYLLRDWDHLIAAIHDLLPRKYEKPISTLAKECDQVLGEFIHGQLLVMLAQGILYSTGLWIVGLEFALLIGMLAGLVSFVPYLGFVVGILVAGAAAFMQFQDVIHLVYVAIVFGIGQAIEGMLLSPLLVGDRIGLHPVAVIFAVMAGGQLFGFIGVLLALPVAAIIVVLLRHVHDEYKDSSFYTP